MFRFIKDEKRGGFLAKIDAETSKLPRPNEVNGRKEDTNKRAMCKGVIRYNTLSYWFLQT